MSPIDPSIRNAVKILRCPISHQSLELLTSEQVADVNARIRQSKILHASGCVVVEEIAAGLVTEDRRYVYPIQDGIIVLLTPLAIALELPSESDAKPICWSAAKRVVQRFYDEFGWQTDSEGTVHDTVRFVDRRPVVADYDSRCHERVAKYLPPCGEYLLDVASGPITHAAYLPYGDNFRYRVCVDLSLEALRQARAKLGHRGIYLLADITKLPLADDSVDAAISLHTIYHVPADEQFQAIHELHRVICPSALAIVVYSWGSHSLLMKPVDGLDRLWWFARGPHRHGRRLRQRLIGRNGRQPPDAANVGEPPLYYHPHDYRTLTGRNWGFDLQIKVWRSVNNVFTRRFVHGPLLGRLLLRLVAWAEDRFPTATGRFGQYPLFVIAKTPKPGNVSEASTQPQSAVPDAPLGICNPPVPRNKLRQYLPRTTRPDRWM